MSVYLHVCLCTVCLAPKGQKDVRHPGDGVTEDCEPPCDCWELNLCPSRLTVEPSLQPGTSIFRKKGNWNFKALGSIIMPLIS